LAHRAHDGAHAASEAGTAGAGPAGLGAGAGAAARTAAGFRRSAGFRGGFAAARLAGTRRARATIRCPARHACHGSWRCPIGHASHSDVLRLPRPGPLRTGWRAILTSMVALPSEPAQPSSRERRRERFRRTPLLWRLLMEVEALPAVPAGRLVVAGDVTVGLGDPTVRAA